MSGFQRVVSVLPEGATNHDVLRNAVLLLGEAIESRGVEHVTVDENLPTFRRDLVTYAADPANAIYLGCRFFDLGLIYQDPHVDSGSMRQNLFEVFDRPVFGVLQDHPFTSFMWSRMQAASRTTHFMSPTAEFQDEAQFINPGLVHFHKVSPALTEPEVSAADIRPLAERPIDIFMACRFYPLRPSLQELRQRYAAAKSPLLKLIDEVYETGLAERDRSIMTLFLEAIERRFGKSLVIECPMTEGDAEIMQILSSIDIGIRIDRRLKVLRNLAQLDPSLRIVVTLDPASRAQIPELHDRPNIELTGWVDAERARETFLNSKFAINVCPTYVSFVTERLPNAMAMGCCVVSDKNRHLESTFAEGEEILFMDGCDLAALTPYFRDDLDRAQIIADRARKKALSEFAVSKMADDFLAILGDVL